MGLEDLPDILTVKEIAGYLKVSEQSVKRAIRDGRLEAFKLGRDWRIRKESITKLFEQGGKYSE